jgi:hypothetical protein
MSISGRDINEAEPLTLALPVTWTLHPSFCFGSLVYGQNVFGRLTTEARVSPVSQHFIRGPYQARPTWRVSRKVSQRRVAGHANSHSSNRTCDMTRAGQSALYSAVGVHLMPCVSPWPGPGRSACLPCRQDRRRPSNGGAMAGSSPGRATARWANPSAKANGRRCAASSLTYAIAIADRDQQPQTPPSLAHKVHAPLPPTWSLWRPNSRVTETIAVTSPPPPRYLIVVRESVSLDT